MHPDLAMLLDLQEKDLALQDVKTRLADIHEEVAVLDRAVSEGEEAVAGARRAASDALDRRVQLEEKIEAYRHQQERRRQRLELTRPGKVAAGLMAELDLARSVLAQEESEWLRLSETVQALEGAVEEAEAALEALRQGQDPARAELLSREEAVLSEQETASGEREASASHLSKPLRIKYDRLFHSRGTTVVVALSGPACGACFTTVPLHRRSQIKNGSVLGGCEVCGVILYDSGKDE
jgi:predicted  nucleic acid-binding Zn-ribbon protein